MNAPNIILRSEPSLEELARAAKMSSERSIVVARLPIIELTTQQNDAMMERNELSRGVAGSQSEFLGSLPLSSGIIYSRGTPAKCL